MDHPSAASPDLIDGPNPDAEPGFAARPLPSPPPNDIHQASKQHHSQPRPLPPPPDVEALAAAQPGGPDAATLAAMGLRPLRHRPHLQAAARLREQHEQRQAENLRWTKQRTTDLFARWHAGPRAWHAWDEWSRREAIERIPVPPRLGGWPGHERVVQGDRLPQIALLQPESGRFARGMRRLDVGRGAAERRRRRRAEKERLGAADVLRREIGKQFEVAGWRFRRRLGVGGFGAVFLFELVSETGQRLPVVVKKGLGDPSSLSREKENIMVSYARKTSVGLTVLIT